MITRFLDTGIKRRAEEARLSVEEYAWRLYDYENEGCVLEHGEMWRDIEDLPFFLAVGDIAWVRPWGLIKVESLRYYVDDLIVSVVISLEREE